MIKKVDGKYYETYIDEYGEEQKAKVSKKEYIEYLETEIKEKDNTINDIKIYNKNQNEFKSTIIQTVVDLLSKDIVACDIKIESLTADVTSWEDMPIRKSIKLGNEYAINIRTAEPKKED